MSCIEDYALIGDCKAAGLVARDGSIDWLCWPRFDSDACFAALLGTNQHGRWQIAPQDGAARVTRRYWPNTMILETRFECRDGAVTLVDFMPMGREHCSVVRLVIGERGRVAMHTEFILRFGYGAVVPWVEKLEDATLRAIAGPDMTVLRTPVDLVGRNLTHVGEFTVAAGDRVPFVLTYGPSHLPPPGPVNAEAALDATVVFWADWAPRCRDAGRWTDAVMRSVLTLKALTYEPTGGIVAAPTASLPERIGGTRNWDYRFCWLRDATFTLLAIMNAGYFEEAQAWRDWLVRAVAGSPDQAQILYGIAGERRTTEWEVPWLPGYEGSAPVRVGNKAHEQLQLDVYGEVLDAFYQARRGGLASSDAASGVELAFLDHLAAVWREPDESIWEVRGGRQHFTYSKIMAWVAFDRAVKSHEAFGRGSHARADRWRRLRAEIHDDVCQHAFDASLGSFVQSYGGKELDASLLQIPIVGFLPVDDPRVVGTVAAIERGLMADGFVMRYRSETAPDGLPAGEGAFLACSFWLVDAYVLLDRWEEARELFDRLVALSNDVGLLSEEFDPRSGRLVGNFPQAFTHVALINSAYNLSRAEPPAEQRAQSEKVKLPAEE
jgi:GH15 family glucan-1,4-alpha-glucosidase